MSRWKYLFFASILILSSNSLFAKSITEFLFSSCDLSVCPTAPLRPFNGFFLGINGGIATNMIETTMFSSVSPRMNISETYTIENDIYQIRPWGEVHGGWGWQLCWLYVGGRIGANFSKFNPQTNLEAKVFDFGTFADIQDNQLKTELRATEFTADFKLGVVFCNNTMLFGLFGGAVNKQYLHGKARFSNQETMDTDQIEVTKKRSSAGLRGGAGIEHMFCKCVSLNLAYVYTRYWNLSANVVSSSIVTNGFNASFASEAHKQVTSIGLTYYY